MDHARYDATIAGGGPSAETRYGAIAVATAMAIITIVAGSYAQARGPILDAFMPICATMWIVADLLTALLLYTQYSVTGTVGILTIAGAYTISGLLAIPFLYAFPGVFVQGPELSQVSVWLWATWHCAFPIVIILTFARDPNLQRRIIEPQRIPAVGLSVMFAAALVAVAACTVVLVFHRALPVFIMQHQFSDMFTVLVLPAIVILNGGGSIFIVLRMGRGSPLHVWIAVALFTSVLDAILVAWSSSRYSVGWYVSKLETLVTASLVLFMLLHEIEALYGRLAMLSTVDPLTGLRNRRSFDEACTLLLEMGARRNWAITALMIDVDHFKQYNDHYGHPSGDETLKRVAEAVRSVLLRSTDIVARYGGEEFVVLLSDASHAEAEDVAQRIRRAVEGLAIPHAASKSAPVVTVSIGVACVPAGQRADRSNLFARADSALYEAKAAGRNRYALAG